MEADRPAVREQRVDHAVRRLEWLALIDGDRIRSRADLARHLGVSRACVTQVLGPLTGPSMRSAATRPSRRSRAASRDPDDAGWVRPA